MGSVRRGEAWEGSDIDLEIVTYETDRVFSWERRERNGIKIDWVVSSKGQIEYQMTHYPFFTQIHADKDTLYDPTGFMTTVLKSNEEYLKQHPDVAHFWEEKFLQMKKGKALGRKESLRDIFDEAERRFSASGYVTRDWFLK